MANNDNTLTLILLSFLAHSELVFEAPITSSRGFFSLEKKRFDTNVNFY